MSMGYFGIAAMVIFLIWLRRDYLRIERGYQKQFESDLERFKKENAGLKKRFKDWKETANLYQKNIEKENAELRGKYINLVNNSAGDIREIRAQKKQLTELAEVAENMLTLLVDNKPIDGLFLSSIEEWDCLIKEAIK